MDDFGSFHQQSAQMISINSLNLNLSTVCQEDALAFVRLGV